MKAVFISDAHLRLYTDERYGRLIRFLNDLQNGKVRALVNNQELGRKVTPIDDLYILGDFFDFWFCRPNRIYREFQPVISKLVELQAGGVRIHLCEGNHDFFMSGYFHDVLGMEVYEEWATIETDQLRMLVSHGDTADRSNRSYMLLRNILHSRAFYHIQRFVPSPLLWALSGLASSASKQMNNDNSDHLIEKMLPLAMEKFQQNYDAVIIGHCHKPVFRHYEADGRKKTFVTLGDWIRHYSFLYFEDGNFWMSSYPPG